MGERLIFARRASGLIRELTAIDVIAWAIAAPAITGFLYFAPRTMYVYSAGGITISYVLAFLIFLPTLVVVALAVSAMPRAGGIFPIMSRIFPPTLTFFFAWIYIVGYGFIIGVVSCVTALMLGSSLLLYGTISGSSGAIAAGSWMLSKTGTSVIAIALIILCWGLTLLGARVVKWFERILFFIPLAILGVMLVLIGVYSGAAYPAVFDKMWGAGVAEAIIAKASELGYTTPALSWDKVYSALIVTMFSYGGFEIISHVSGEVRSPKRSLLYGYILGFVLTMVLYLIVAAVIWSIQGFVNPYSFLYYEHPDALAEIMPSPPEPSLLLFAASASKYMAFILPPFIVLWLIKSIVPCFVGVSRVTFSLAMDRLIPIRFADVNRFGAPSWSSHMMAILSLVGVYVFTMKVSAVLALLTWAGFCPFWLFGLGMLMFPFVRKEIFEKTPIQWKFAGFPVISIVGFIAMASSFFVFCYTLTEVPMGAIPIIILLIAIGMIIHCWQTVKNEKEGISYADIYAELPPE